MLDFILNDDWFYTKKWLFLYETQIEPKVRMHDHRAKIKVVFITNDEFRVKNDGFRGLKWWIPC